MITINLNADSQLFLTQSEARQLARDLTDQLQAALEIVVADVPLTVDEGWRVLENVEKAVAVDWKVEGF